MIILALTFFAHALLWISAPCTRRFTMIVAVPACLILSLFLVRQRRRRTSFGLQRASRTPHDVRLVRIGVGEQERGFEAIQGKRVRFNPRVSCHPIPDMTELPSDRKAAFWWQVEDFHEFLQVRVAIGQAYEVATQNLGMDAMEFGRFGARCHEGYQTMIRAFPNLGGESRRGLGLGRANQRANARITYIQAVISEQRRQRLSIMGDQFIDVDNYGEPMIPADFELLHNLTEDEKKQRRQTHVEALRQVPLDFGAISAAATYTSEKVSSYAVYLARMYYEYDIADEMAEERRVIADGRTHVQKSLVLRVPFMDEFSSFLPGPKDGFAMSLNDIDEPHRSVEHVNVSRGFGISTEMLHRAGLNATGHVLHKPTTAKPHRHEDFGFERMGSAAAWWDNTCMGS